MKIKDGFVIEKVGDGYLAVAVGGRAEEFAGLVKMNSTGAFLWKLIEKESLTAEELLEKILSEYEVDEGVAKADIADFEKQLREAGVLE